MEVSNACPGVEGILVGIRMRPLNDKEVAAGQDKAFKCMNTYNAVTQLTKDGHPVEGQMYYYDKVFDERSNTGDVYSHIGKDVVKGVVNGINGTIFAYGQTSSGKTHTMLGNQKDERGVLEMAAEDIFTHICNTAGRDFLLRVSFVEIYNEIIRDLLSDASDATVNIREDPKRGVYCEASESVITDYESIIRALKKGISRRAVEATAMNDTSSRSHTIFKLVIESKENGRGDNADPDGAVLVSSLNLVDLAGSESVRHTGATGQRAKEGGKINQSLLSLSRVIHALSQPGAHVSFRDSKLTRLLQPSLSGNAKMSVVCCITPAEKYLEETRSTLQFASRAKLVKTHAVVNEVLDEVAALKRLKKELEELKEKQRANTGLLSEEEQARIEAEKADMLARLESLQKERDVQLQQLERLKELIVVGEKSTAAAAAAVDRTKRRKRHRDTWCPGATSAVFSLAPVMVASDVVVDDENMLDQEDGASAGDRSAGSCKSDTSSGSVIVQALSAQLASRDDVIAALRDQIREMQQVPGSNKNTNLEKMDGSYEDEEEEDGDDTVPLEEDDKEAVGQQLAEALVQVQSLTAVVSDKEAQVAELTQVLERRLHEAEAAAQADAQTESLVRGLEEDVARAQEQLEQAQTVVAQLTQRVQGLEGELAQAHAQVPPHAEAVDEHAQEQIGTLTAELASAEELIQEMEADAAAVRQSLEESHQREENLAVAVQEADAEVGALREQIAALELQLEGALSDLSEQRAQFVESSKEHQAAQAQAAEALEVARSETAVLLAAKEQELAGAAEFKGYAEAAGARVVELEALLEEAQAKAASTDVYVASLKVEAGATLEALQARLGAAERDLEAKNETIVAALAAATAVSASAPGPSGSSTVMHTHRQDVDSQELTQESIEAARREMEKAVEAMRAELGTKEAEVSRLMAASAEWADRATRAERIVNESEQRAVGAAGEDEALRKRVGQLQTQCDLLRSERDVAAKKLSETEAELRAQAGRGAVAEDALTAQLQLQQSKLDKMTAQAGEAQRLHESVRALEAKAATTREERDEFKGYAEAAGARVVELEALLEEAQAKAKAAELSQAAGAGMDALVASLKDEAAVAARAATEAVARGDQLELDLGEANLRLKKSREEMAALRSEWDRGGAQMSALEEAKAALEAQRDEFKGYAEAAGARVVELEASEASLQQQLEEALGQVQALTEALTEAESLTLALPMPVPAPTADPALLAEANARADEAESEAALLREALTSGRQQARTAVDGLQQRLTATLGELQAMRDDLTEKDKRIAHLETTKLTQDQLNKIKAVKEERKRLSEDNKVMKKQLQQLKKAYDDLKVSGSSSSSSSVSGAAAGVETGDLRAQLEAAQGVAQTLKDKLRECSQQLQEYETERAALVEVLGMHGVDTAALEAADLSLSLAGDDGTGLGIGRHPQDLAEAVAELAARAKRQGEELEERIEALKAAAETSGEEFQALVADCDDLRAKVAELQELLGMADQRAASSADNVSSEVQALEEENIELMRENRELRKDLGLLKLQLSKAGVAPSVSTSVARESTPGLAQAGKENMPLSVLNTHPDVGGGGDRKRPLGADSLVKPSPAAAGPTPGDDGKAKKATHKKAKALVSATGAEPAAVDGAGDCAQS